MSSINGQQARAQSAVSPNGHEGIAKTIELMQFKHKPSGEAFVRAILSGAVPSAQELNNFCNNNQVTCPTPLLA